MPKGLFQFWLLAILFLTACDDASNSPESGKTMETWFPLSVGGSPIEAQLAVSLAEKRKGLMYRQELPAERGMLFIYPTPQRVTFWMANTPLPLDLGLFDSEGVLKEIHRLVPYDTTKVRSHSREIQFALEMNRGWFAGKGLYPGSVLDLTAVSEATRRSGLNPAELGLE